MNTKQSWLVIHPNGEYVKERYRGYTYTTWVPQAAHRYTREVARKIARNFIGGKTVRYEDAVQAFRIEYHCSFS